MALVSIIIPNYNHENFLIQRIESVLNQTFQDFELIILDDCSNDNSKNIIENYRNYNKVKHVEFNTINSGSVFKQWIKGIELANGEYIWIAESDDYSDSLFLEKTVAKIQNTNFGAVFTDTFQIDEYNNVKRVSQNKREVFDELYNSNLTITSKNLDLFLLDRLVILNVSSVLFRKTALREIDLIELNKLKSIGDVFSYISICLKYDIFYVDEPLNYMRIQSTSATIVNRINGNIFKEKIHLLTYLIEKLKELNVSKKHIYNYFIKIFLSSIDFGYKLQIQNLIKSLKKNHFFNNNEYICFNFLIFFYSNKFIKRFYFVRKIINKNIQHK